MARAYVVPGEPGWGPRQVLTVTLERLGYTVDAYGAGDTWILLLS